MTSERNQLHENNKFVDNIQWRIQTFHLMGGGGGHEMRLNAKVTVENFGGRELIYNKIKTRKI